jgi:hypothetical protein
MPEPANATIALVFGTVTPPQTDVIDLLVHVGCSKEVSSFEVRLWNFDSKYSIGGTTPITVGMDGSISLGRGATCPLLMTLRVEKAKYGSTPDRKSYIKLSGRCWGERLFRRTVTKTYTGWKGEAIVKDLIDYYVGLSHNRGGVELIEDTDTTYLKLEYTDSPVWDILKYVAETADKAGVIGYDFRVAPDGKFEFFAKNSKTQPVYLTEAIDGEASYERDIFRIRNRIKINGIADKSVPADKVSWTQSLTPTNGAWTTPGGFGAASIDNGFLVQGNPSIKLAISSQYYGELLFTLDSGHEVDTALYPSLPVWLYLEKKFSGNILVALFDDTGKNVYKNTTVATGDWQAVELPVGPDKTGSWDIITAGFNWSKVKQVGFIFYLGSYGSGKVWINAMHFGGCRYSAIAEDPSSVGYPREYNETDEELVTDSECDYRAKALLAYLKDAAEYINLTTTLYDYGSTPLLAGDRQHVILPNERIADYYRCEFVEYRVPENDPTVLETTMALGKEPPQIADYLYGLRTFTVNVEKLSRTKLGKKTFAVTTQSGNAGAHQQGHTYGDTAGAQWAGTAGGWDPITGWIGPAFVGPFNDAASFTFFRTKNIAGNATVNHVFAPWVDNSGILGHSNYRWAEANIYLAKLGLLNVAGFDIITALRVLQNVTADVAIITSGQFALGRMPRGDSGYVLESQGATFDPMYVDPNGRYYPAGHGHAAEDITSGGETADVDIDKVGGGTRTLHFVNSKYTGYTDS